MPSAWAVFDARKVPDRSSIDSRKSGNGSIRGRSSSPVCSSKRCKQQHAGQESADRGGAGPAGLPGELLFLRHEVLGGGLSREGRGG